MIGGAIGGSCYYNDCGYGDGYYGGGGICRRRRGYRGGVRGQSAVVMSAVAVMPAPAMRGGGHGRR